MKHAGFKIVSVAAGLALLAGCGGSMNAGSTPTVLAPQAPRSTGVAARSSALLYASNVYGCSVFVYTYPHGKLKQTLDPCSFGFGPAFGLCTDKSGNVYMAMGEGFSIFKIAHGGSQPISQLEDDRLLPLGCSVDPTTGDLGVASAEGNVAVFKNASGTPQVYSLSDVSEFFFCTYDNHGNLFADGEHSDHSFALAELPSGGGALREISVPGSFTSGLALQWDGRHIAIGQTQSSSQFVLDRIRVSGSAAKIIGTTTLDFTPNTYTPFQFWIQGGKIVQPEANNTVVGLWSYPRGGVPIKNFPNAHTNLDGIAISVAPR